MNSDGDLENFNDFIEEVSESIPEPENIIDEDISSLNTDITGENLCCPYCSWIPRSHAKNKQKSILNHITKKHPERLNEY